MSLFKKKKEFHMDVKAADQTLQNVFEACNKGPNTVPFDKILLRCRYNGSSFDICIICSIILLAITLLVPLKLLPAFNYNSNRLTLVTHEQYSDYLLVTVSQQDISLEDCYFSDFDGNVVYAVGYNPLGRTVKFPFPDKEVNLTITTDSGTELHLLFTPES